MCSFEKILFLFIFVSVCCLTSAPSYAQYDPANVKKVITELGQQVVKDPLVPGVSIAVLKKGETTPVSVAFGTACIENNCPLTIESRFKIGSVTKVFTASLIHRFIEEGRLSYDTPIDTFFPKFPEGNIITIRHLLNHTSGIVDMLSLKDVYSNMTLYRSPAELVGMVAKQPLQFLPGTQQKYCNTGYLMLAVIAETISGKTFAEQMQELFVEKLGMKSLIVGSDSAIVPNMSCGYTSPEKSGLRLPIMASIGIAAGTGNLEAKPEDVVRLVNLGSILKNNVLDTITLTPLILSDGKVAQSSQGAKNFSVSYLDGCTLFMFREPEITLVGKLGSFPGFGTAYFYDQKTMIAVAISVNNEMALSNAIDLGARILYALR